MKGFKQFDCSNNANHFSNLATIHSEVMMNLPKLDSAQFMNYFVHQELLEVVALINESVFSKFNLLDDPI